MDSVAGIGNTGKSTSCFKTEEHPCVTTGDVAPKQRPLFQDSSSLTVATTSIPLPKSVYDPAMAQSAVEVGACRISIPGSKTLLYAHGHIHATTDEFSQLDRLQGPHCHRYSALQETSTSCHRDSSLAELSCNSGGCLVECVNPKGISAETLAYGKNGLTDRLPSDITHALSMSNAFSLLGNFDEQYPSRAPSLDTQACMAKRRRTEIPIVIKKEICQFKAENPQTTMCQLVKLIHCKYGLTVGRTTVSDIIHEQDKWLGLTASAEMKRIRVPKYCHLDSALYCWYKDAVSRNELVNDRVLLDKAKLIGTVLGIQDLNYSNGWLFRFKRRHGIGMTIERHTRWLSKDLQQDHSRAEDGSESDIVGMTMEDDSTIGLRMVSDPGVLDCSSLDDPGASLTRQEPSPLAMSSHSLEAKSDCGGYYAVEEAQPSSEEQRSSMVSCNQPCRLMTEQPTVFLPSVVRTLTDLGCYMEHTVGFSLEERASLRSILTKIQGILDGQPRQTVITDFFHPRTRQ